MSSRNKRRSNRRNKANSQNVRRQEHERGTGHDARHDAAVHPTRPSTETKASPRTTELVLYTAAVLAVIMTALAVDADGAGGGDPFGAERALRYITFLTIGYMVARGLAKAASRERAGVRHVDETDDAARSPRDDDTDARDDARDGDVQRAGARDSEAPDGDDARDSEAEDGDDGRDSEAEDGDAHTAGADPEPREADGTPDATTDDAERSDVSSR